MSEKNSTETGRTASFARNTELESLLKDINSNLWLSEKTLLEKQGGLQHPVILVMGPMRSGTTLFMQWLANTGLVAYPTNLLSRFYQAPIIGAKLQLLLTDPRYNFRNELGEFVQQLEYRSENGKTQSVLAPNEFWYFWRRFLAEPGRDVWTNEELNQSMDTRTMLAELAGMMQVFQKPFAAKCMLFNYNIPFLDSVFDKVLFVQIKRELASNIASVLDARKRQLASESAWYSFKIPEYELLKNRDPVTQVTGQIYFTNKAVKSGLAKVNVSRKLTISYEDFCQAPEDIFLRIKDMLGFDRESVYRGPTNFNLSRNPDTALVSQVNRALESFDQHGAGSSNY